MFDAKDIFAVKEVFLSIKNFIHDSEDEFALQVLENDYFDLILPENILDEISNLTQAQRNMLYHTLSIYLKKFGWRYDNSNNRVYVA